MRRAKTSELAAIALGLGLIATPAFAGWQDTASAFDANRLAKLSESKAKGLEEAEHGASASDLAIIHGVLDAPPAPGGELTGNWRCRTIKLGGMTPDVIYSWFRCRITDEGGTMHFAKISGYKVDWGIFVVGLVLLGVESASIVDSLKKLPKPQSNTTNQ